jgi:hypothetical protein
MGRKPAREIFVRRVSVNLWKTREILGADYFKRIRAHNEPAMIVHKSPEGKNLSRKNFQRYGFFTRGTRIETVCFQRLVFGLVRAPVVNRRREDEPRIPLGD